MTPTFWKSFFQNTSKIKEMSATGDEKTPVDLGEDLIEPTTTAVTFEKTSQKVPLTLEKIEDLFQSAKILVQEGILEDAKRILRQILRFDSNQVNAKKLLEELGQQELKAMLGDSSTKNREGLSLEELDSEQVMRFLDADLGLGIFSDPEFTENLDQELATLTPKDRIDIGIAFLEMGLYDLAARQFLVAKREAHQFLVASSLLAYSLIMAGRAYEATHHLEPILGDSEFPATEKIDLIYLMGRAYEQLRRPDLAFQWYEQVFQVDPHYRDVEKRLQQIQRVN